MAASATGASAEVRGTWLTTTGVDHISSGVNNERIFEILRQTGLNTAYIESWKNGFPQFQSDAWDDVVGSSSANRQVLERAVIQAHRQNLAAVAWFEYGFAASFAGANTTVPNGSFARAADDRGWLLQDASGRFTNSQTSFQWMNPAIPEVRTFLVDLVVDSIRGLDLDGIQFDDRLAWPTTLGYGPATQAAVNARAGFDVPVGTNAYEQWLDVVRDESLAAFVDELHTAVRAVDPDISIGLAPAVNGFSQQQLTADWPTWVAQGYFDEVVPQVYRPSIASFNASLPSNVSPFTSTGREDIGVIGLRFNGSGSDTPLADVLAMIEATRDAASGELAGHSIWYSDNVVDFADELRAFYDPPGRAGPWVPNPWLEPGQRPDAVVGVADATDDDAWTVVVTEEGAYRVVAPTDNFGRWEQIDVRYFRPGESVVLAPEARDELELLIDRRPLDFDVDGDGLWRAVDADAFYAQAEAGNLDFDLTADGVLDGDDLMAFAALASTTPGDLDFDGDLDLADAQALIAAYGQTVSRVDGVRGWTSGDLDLNGEIDFADAMALLHHARAAGLNATEFAALSDSLIALPEPASAVALLSGAALAIRNRPRTAKPRR
ncbi:MAG: family 10 glycosylhydrolase [Planctomycetota bacterium]